jgi:hypothetical protein
VLRSTIALLCLAACKKDEPPAPKPEPVPAPVPAPQPEPETGPPTQVNNAEAYDFGLGDTDAIYAEAAGSYEVTCVGANATGFLGGAYAVVGPGRAMALLHSDGTEFASTVPDGQADFAERSTDATANATWTLTAQGEGPDMNRTFVFAFGDDGEIGIVVLDPTGGSVHCVDYASAFRLDSGTAPPALLTDIGTAPIRLTGDSDQVDVSVSPDGVVSVDRGPAFDGVAEFSFPWTGGGDLAFVDMEAGDWAVTAPDGTWTITIQASGGTGHGGVTLTGGTDGLTGLLSDQIDVD